jgi:hypothetical protein
MGHRPLRLRFPRERVFAPGIDLQWQADLSDLSALKRHNGQHKFLLCVIDVFSKYAWVRALKDKTGATLVRVFGQILRELKRSPRRLQTDKGTKFLNRKFQAFFRHSLFHERKSRDESQHRRAFPAYAQGSHVEVFTATRRTSTSAFCPNCSGPITERDIEASVAPRSTSMPQAKSPFGRACMGTRGGHEYLATA